jgi:hypothetical protein
LFVGTTHRDTDEFTVTGTYYLTNPGPNGNFDPTVASATLLFGGDQDKSRHGRFATITWLTDAETGKKVDRNIVATTYTDNDHLRFYDLDTMSEDFVSDAVLSVEQPSFGTNTDPGMPWTGNMAFALTPNGMLLAAGRGQNDDLSAEEGTEISVLDPKNAEGTFFNVKTDPAKATANLPTPIANIPPLDLESIGNDEYLLLLADPNGRGSARARLVLYRIKVTLPENLATAAPESLKIEVVGAPEELITTDPDDTTIVTKDLLGTGEFGITGMAVGRPVGDNGPRRLYFATFGGELITATPVVTPPAAGS